MSEKEEEGLGRVKRGRTKRDEGRREGDGVRGTGKTKEERWNVAGKGGAGRGGAGCKRSHAPSCGAPNLANYVIQVPPGAQELRPCATLPALLAAASGRDMSPGTGVLPAAPLPGQGDEGRGGGV